MEIFRFNKKSLHKKNISRMGLIGHLVKSCIIIVVTSSVFCLYFYMNFLTVVYH